MVGHYGDTPSFRGVGAGRGLEACEWRVSLNYTEKHREQEIKGDLKRCLCGSTPTFLEKQEEKGK